MYRIVLIGAVILAATAAYGGPPRAIALPLNAAAILLSVLAFAFRSLTVRDEGTHLAIRFGPLPFFWKRISYERITEVKRARSSFVDGWGIHYIAGRGWIYNLWGFDCVEIRAGGRLLRIGTDDPEGLAAFLEEKTRRL
jgi:hypothetical protein